jgi:hypothetical protein
VAKEIDLLLTQDPLTANRLSEAKASLQPRQAFEMDDDVPF